MMRTQTRESTSADRKSTADDAALLDDTAETATRRVTSISAGSKRDADMVISVSKTECMHIRSQGKMSPVTHDEAKAHAKFKCPNGW